MIVRLIIAILLGAVVYWLLSLVAPHNVAVIVGILAGAAYYFGAERIT